MLYNVVNTLSNKQLANQDDKEISTPKGIAKAIGFGALEGTLNAFVIVGATVVVTSAVALVIAAVKDK